VLQGASPNEAFEARWPNDNPPARFDASCWHLVAHYVQKKVVGRDGISFTDQSFGLTTILDTV